ncbi:hypothetical protein LCGC14_0890410 [marine sediment metagenome]|uniref:Uncharacterized protein n=1 Tax=marine sediment metagenome TaxID=412755 RepID=A0A0F9RIS5_9ZZZZ
MATVIEKKDWKIVFSGGEENLRVSCPRCGRVFFLDHDVDHMGNVFPSLQCPDEECGYHDFAVLKDFRGFSEH